MPEGGLVPKSLYKEEHVDRSPDEPPIHIGDSLYNTAHVVKEFPNEVGTFSFSYIIYHTLPVYKGSI